jgi:hypothetical protein
METSFRHSNDYQGGHGLPVGAVAFAACEMPLCQVPAVIPGVTTCNSPFHPN